jgi:hypothetical protein
MKLQKFFLFQCLSFVLLSSCAILHHAQIGEIENPPGYEARPFDIKVSETGVNVQEAADVGKIFLKNKQKEEADKLAGLISLFQMGPRTGNGVYDRTYADEILKKIYEACPSGNVTGLMSIRETRKYPVISGEIVKITGYCLTKESSSPSLRNKTKRKSS